MVGLKTISTLAFALVAIVANASVASAGDAPDFTTLWQPPGMLPTSDTTPTVIARMRLAAREAGLPAEGRTETFRIEANGKIVAATASVLGDDYAVRAIVDDRAISLGRANGVRWRANAAGTMRAIRADVQGDDLDRWPVAFLGFRASDCTLVGVAKLSNPAWVLADRPARDIARWLFVDEATGDIVREMSREGSRIVTYDFSEFRGTPPDRRPFAWTISGAGGRAHVAVLDDTPRTIDPADVAVPAQGLPDFSPTIAPRRLTSEFRYGEIVVKLRLDGKQRDFILDSGTPEIIVNGAIARETGSQTLGHGNATIGVDGAVGSDVPYIAVDFWADGLLGYDFFRGRIVHVDYASQEVDVLPRDGFAPPRDALSVKTDWSEGMPLVTARVGQRAGDRFALDVGSGALVLSDAFMRRDGPAPGVARASETPHAYRYLEGPILVVPAVVDTFSFGPLTISAYRAQVEAPNAANLSIPLDGIIGIRNFAQSEWWFDADGTTTWFRPLH